MKQFVEAVRNRFDAFMKIWASPVFPEDEERARMARVLNAVLLVLILATAIYFLASVTVYVQKFFNLIFSGLWAVLAATVYWLMRLGKVRMASLVLVSGLWVISTIEVILSGGPRTVAAAMFLAVTTIAGLLLGEKAAVRVTILSVLSSLAMLVWELSGHALPAVFPLPPTAAWVILVLCLLFVTVAINQSTRSFRQALASAHDQVAERQKVEKVLREKEQLFAGIAENVPGLILQVRFNPDGSYRFTYANPRGLEMMELPPDVVDKGYEIGTKIYFEDRPAFFQLLQETIARRSSFRTEFRRVMSDGKLHWALAAVSPVMDGDTVIYNGLMLDIDEVKQSKAETERLNQALHRRVEERTRELAALSRVMTLSVQSDSPDQLASNILDVVFETAECAAAMVHMSQDEEGLMLLQAECGLPAELAPVYQVLSLDDNLLGKVARSSETLVVNDLSQMGGEPPSALLGHFKAFVGVPICIKGRQQGVLSVFSASGQRFTAEFVYFLTTISDMLGVAVDNIDLRRQAEQAAMLEERQRLARDLHDSVSQTMFSASALAETLPLVWDQDPDRGKIYVASLLRLTRSALAEMRTLLVELRPQALLRTDLGDLVRQLAHGFAGHTQAEVTIDITGKGVLAADVQTVFFRVTQETLHNIAKHARASHVTIHFQLEPAWARLKIEDNGQGFDPAQKSAGFGIKIMQERAAIVNARLELTSQPGHGTMVTLEWQDAERMARL